MFVTGGCAVLCVMSRIKFALQAAHHLLRDQSAGAVASLLVQAAEAIQAAPSGESLSLTYILLLAETMLFVSREKGAGKGVKTLFMALAVVSPALAMAAFLAFMSRPRSTKTTVVEMNNNSNSYASNTTMGGAPTKMD